jgi:predicted RNase H-like HicB family nuclease
MRKCWTQDAGDVLGAAVGIGDSLEEAQCNAVEAAESVKAEGIYFNTNTFDEADENIAEAKRLGVW